MKHRIPTIAVALAAAVACAVPTAVAVAGPAAPSVPDRITVDDGHKPYLITHAEGVQIYTCGATASGGYAWGPSTPRADLFDGEGKTIGRHYGGPSWETRDGSRVTAARVDSVTVEPTAIPWLLLKATPVPGTEGDRLDATTFIQRVATEGGLAPAAGECTAASAGTVREVPYEADYVFWKRSAA